MRRSADVWKLPLQTERIRRLESELWSARRTIVGMAAEPLAEALLNYRDCQSEDDFWRWRQQAIETVISAATVDPEISYLQPRAWCPLCRGGSSGPFDRGFSIPEGMRRHLDGHGNVAACPVTAAAFWLAREGLQDRFEADKRTKEAILLERRETERLYLTHPNEPPRLLEERVEGWIGELRDAAAMHAAEQRLLALGFGMETSGNVVSWRLQTEGWTVLADPRSVGRIACVLYRTEILPVASIGRSRKRHSPRPVTSSFTLLDTWKHDIPGKFRQRMEDAARELSARDES